MAVGVLLMLAPVAAGAAEARAASDDAEARMIDAINAVRRTNGLHPLRSSATHRALVLTSMMRWAGAGVTRGRFGAKAATIWVLHLGRVHPPGAPLPVPSLPLP
jgi:hypothetical protein